MLSTLGSEVVLGPPSPVTYMRMPPASPSGSSLGVPVEQAISRQRLRPGSGFLAVKVVTEGPTRVLQISDVKQKVKERATSEFELYYYTVGIKIPFLYLLQRAYARLEERDWLHVGEGKRPSLVGKTSLSNSNSSSNNSPDIKVKGGGDREFQIVILAKAGIGLSLVSKDPPEELLYAFMSNVVVDYQISSTQCILDGSVQNVQVRKNSYPLYVKRLMKSTSVLDPFFLPPD